MCLISKKKVLFYTDGKNGSSPRERTRRPNQRHVVLGEQGARACLAITPLLVCSVGENNDFSDVPSDPLHVPSTSYVARHDMTNTSFFATDWHVGVSRYVLGMT